MKKYFSRLLYVEGLKKMRVVGILGIILTAAASLIPCVTNATDTSVSTLSTALLPLLVFAPATVISAFSFLHKRRSSDFYHSMPVSRICMFFSFFLAAFTWTVGAVLICWSLCAAVTVPFGALTPASALILIPAYLFACLLLSGIAALAVSATGTSFAATVVFLFSVLTPTLIGDLFVRLLSIAVPSYAAQEDFLSILFFDNTMIGEIYGYNGENASLLWSLRLYILTLFATLVFIGGALLVFVRRQSEWATRPAPGGGIRALYRCLATLPIGIGYTFYCLYNLEKYPEVDLTESSFVTTSVLIAILCVFVWFLLELLFTKKIKLALASLPQLILLLGGCALFILCYVSGKSILLNYVPKPSEIHSFAVSYDKSSGISYDAEYLSDIFVADDDLEKLLSDSLASTNQSIKKGSERVYDPYVTVRFRLNSGITVARKVTFEDITVSELKYRCALASEKFMEGYLKLPSNPTDSSYGWFAGSYSSSDSGVTALSIWNVFATEYDTLSPEQQLEVKRSTSTVTEPNYLPIISAGFKKDDVYFGMSAYIPEYMTDTRQYYFTLLKKGTGNTHKNIYDELPNFGTASYDLVSGDTLVFAKGEMLFGGNLPANDKDKLKEIFSVILKDSKITETVPLATESYITLDMRWEVRTVNGDVVSAKEYSRTAALSISEETARILSDMLKNNN